MRINKTMQYALLLVLYLCRSGRARLSDIAYSLGLSPLYLKKVAAALTRAAIIKGKSGHGGGYELAGDPKVRDVFHAVAPPVLTGRESHKYAHGQPEHRALGLYATALKSTLEPLMRRHVHSLNKDLVESEMKLLAKPMEAEGKWA